MKRWRALPDHCGGQANAGGSLAPGGCGASQLALAWLLAQGDDLVPIPGTTRVQYLEENLDAPDVHLSTEDLRRIEEISPRGVAAGMRYPEGGMATVNR